MPRKAKLWRKIVGEWGSRVTCFERQVGGNLYLGVPLPGKGLRMVTLGHRDKEAALKEAVELSAQRTQGTDKPSSGPLTVAAMFGLYLKSVDGHQGRVHSLDTKRSAELWTRFLGAEFVVQKFNLSDWESFQRKRGSGEIDARGHFVSKLEAREPVKARILAKDLKAFKAACSRAASERTGEDSYLLQADPTRGKKFRVPRELNPYRPVVGADRVDALLAVAHEVTMRVGYGKKARWVPSYLPTLIRLGADTGRRLASLLALRGNDWRPELGACGQIRWRAAADKSQKDWWAPVTPAVRAELASIPTPIGEALFFPAPNNPDRPLDEQRALDWLRKAEKLAGLEIIKGGGYHCLRRKWACERKDLSSKDVAAVGGWRDTATLINVYQVADADTMELVVNSPKRMGKVG
jgi:integrase